MSHDHDHAPEPIRGLPERLPAGEFILWQGEPRWTALARHAFHVRKIAFYFAVLLAWRLVNALGGGQTLPETLVAAVPLTVLAVFALGVLGALAWFTTRTTVYTITNRRVVMRIGIALSITVNVPFKIINAAAVRLYPDGSGDIPLTVQGTGGVGYVPLWPHARPWKLSKPEPMLRSVPDAARVAQLLSAALAAAGAAPASAPATVVRATENSMNRAEMRMAEERAPAAAAAWPKAIA